MKITIKEMQTIELAMLKEFHKLCQINHLKYYLVGGTLLGAVRHRGFIPWDDDIDVAMPRNDYEKLMKLANNNISSYYRIVNYRNEENYVYNFAKMENTNTILIEDEFKHLNRVGGIYIDIFPLDGTFDNNIMRNIHFHSIQFMSHINGALTLDVYDEKKSFIKRKIGKFIQNYIDGYKFRVFFDKLLSLKAYNDSDIIANFMGAWGKREVMNKNLFGVPNLYLFEDQYFYSVSNFDSVLKQLYGDYMVLPPIEKRVSHHKYFVDIKNNIREDFSQ